MGNFKTNIIVKEVMPTLILGYMYCPDCKTTAEQLIYFMGDAKFNRVSVQVSCQVLDCNCHRELQIGSDLALELLTKYLERRLE